MTKLPDLLSLKNQEPKNFLQFAASQLQGTRPRQEDFFLNFNDECFIVTDGIGGSLHGDVAAKEACETALWAYKLVRQRPFYWSEKKAFMARIFRSTNLALWQKQKIPKFEGLATTLDVVIASRQTWWLGHIGDGSIFLIRNGQINKLTVDHTDENGELTKYIGQRRLGLKPQVRSGRFLPNDIILMVTDGVTNALAPDTLQAFFKSIATRNLAPIDVVVSLLQKANEAGDSDNMTTCLIRRIPS